MAFWKSLLIIIIILVCGFLYSKLNSVQSDSPEIIDIIRQHKDAQSFINKYPDFKIQSKKLLTKEDITAGQNGKTFKELYNNLLMEDDRYVRVDLINGQGTRGLLSVIDVKEKVPVNVYGLVLLNIGSK